MPLEDGKVPQVARHDDTGFGSQYFPTGKSFSRRLMEGVGAALLKKTVSHIFIPFRGFPVQLRDASQVGEITNVMIEISEEAIHRRNTFSQGGSPTILLRNCNSSGVSGAKSQSR